MRVGDDDAPVGSTTPPAGFRGSGTSAGRGETRSQRGRHITSGSLRKALPRPPRRSSGLETGPTSSDGLQVDGPETEAGLGRSRSDRSDVRTRLNTTGPSGKGEVDGLPTPRESIWADRPGHPGYSCPCVCTGVRAGAGDWGRADGGGGEVQEGGSGAGSGSVPRSSHRPQIRQNKGLRP